MYTYKSCIYLYIHTYVYIIIYIYIIVLIYCRYIQMQWPRRATCLLDRRQGWAFTIKVIPCNCKTQNVKERSIAAPPRDSSQPLFDIGDWLKTRCVRIIIAIHQSPVGPIPGDRIMVQGRPTDPSRYAEHDARCPPLRTAPDEPAEWKERWSRRWLWSGLLNVFLWIWAYRFTLWWTNILPWKIPIFNGKIHHKWPFSIAMLVHQAGYQRIFWCSPVGHRRFKDRLVAEKVWNQKTELSCPVEWPEPQPLQTPRAGWRYYEMCDTTSSTAQGGGGSFKNRKPIGEVGCCESGMAKRIHWLTERWLELCLLEWLQWLQWSPHPQLLDVVWCTATVVVVVA